MGNMTSKLADTDLRVRAQSNTGLAPNLVPTMLSVRFSRIVSYVTNALAYSILLAGTATAFSAVYLGIVGYSVVPFWDEMHEIQLYILQRQSVLHWIWAQHNEHRVLFYKLLFVIDMQFFRGRNWPMFVGIFFCQATLAIIVAYMLRKLGSLNGSSGAAIFGAALYCLFCPSQKENFTWAFQLSFALVSVWVITAILLLVLQRQHLNEGMLTSSRILWMSLAVAVAASFTNGNGIVVWPIMIVLALTMNFPWRLVGLYVLGFVCAASLYRIGYKAIPPTHAHPLDSIQKPLQVLEYMEKYLGGAAVANTHLDWAVHVGQLGLTIAVVVIFWLIIRREKVSLLEFGLAGILLYSLSTAFITSLGRLSFGTDQAFASRYQGFALLFWFALLACVISILVQRQAVYWLITVYLLIVAVTLNSSREYGSILAEVRDMVANRGIGGIAMIVGVHDDKFLKQAVCPFPEATWASTEYLREHGLSLFSGKMAKQFKQDLSANYIVTAASPCRGSVDIVQQGDDNSDHLRLEGWIVDRHAKPVSRLLFVEDGKIVGFGLSGRERLDVVNALQSNAALRSGWEGYANISEVGRPIDVYGVVNSAKNRACYLRTVSFDPATQPPAQVQRDSKVPGI